jgi:hypothetical protein
MDVDAYRVVAPNISLSMDPHLAEVRRLGNGSPSPGSIQPSKSGTKKIVSAKQSRQRQSPNPKAAHMLPSLPFMAAKQAAPDHPPADKAKSPIETSGARLRAPHAATTAKRSPKGSRVQASDLPSKVREEQCTAYVANEINEIEIRQPSPELLTALSPSNPPSAPPMQMHLPPYESDEPARESEPERQTYDVSQGEKIGTN